MTLSRHAQILLQECGQFMAKGEDNPILGLHHIVDEFNGSKDEVVALLAESVKEVSGGLRTVQRCDSSLFATQVEEVLCLVVCDAATNSDGVYNLTDDMVLYTASPYSNGIRLGERATVEVRGLLQACQPVLERRLSLCTDDEERRDAEYALRNVSWH